MLEPIAHNALPPATPFLFPVIGVLVDLAVKYLYPAILTLADLPGITTPPVEIPGFTFGSATTSGLLCWYLWYTQSRTFPNMIQEHRQERQQYAQNAEKERERAIDKFTATLKEIAATKQKVVYTQVPFSSGQSPTTENFPSETPPSKVILPDQLQK